MNDSASDNKIKISLLMATFGRNKEVFDFCESLNLQDCDLNSLELIIVDQNDDSKIENSLRIKKYKYEIIYIKESIKSLSNARNIGLKVARGFVIGYPDDDCLYYPNTVSEVLKFFCDDFGKKLLIGRIYDRDSKKNIIKNWPSSNKKVNFLNYYRFCNSVTLFHSRGPELCFDSRMGAGKFYGSTEDVDFVYRWLEAGLKADYVATIDVWHPESKLQEIPLCKVRSYARGFGFFIRKNHSFVMYKYIHLILLIGYKISQLAANFFKRKFKSGYFSQYVVGLLEGFLISER
jgi:glycosyltransferase involved in cell wall biosynthesis